VKDHIKFITGEKRLSMTKNNLTISPFKVEVRYRTGFGMPGFLTWPFQPGINFIFFTPF
jgi:hypothetical protein